MSDILQALSVALYMPLVSMLFILPMLAYVLVRWRDDRDGRPRDADLGVKTLIGLFLVLGLNLVFASGASIFGALFAGSDVEELAPVLATGLVGLIVLGLDAVFLGRTNYRDRPAVMRIFWGFSTVLAAFSALVGMVLWFTHLIKGTTGSDTAKAGLAVMLVYVPAWIGQLILIARRPSMPVEPNPS
jgi:hypothetical protein